MSDNMGYLDESQKQILADLQEAYADIVDESVDLKLLCGNLKKENKQLKEMLQKWTDENTMLKESLDQAERELLNAEGDETPVNLNEWRNV